MVPTSYIFHRFIIAKWFLLADPVVSNFCPLVCSLSEKIVYVAVTQPPTTSECQSHSRLLYIYSSQSLKWLPIWPQNVNVKQKLAIAISWYWYSIQKFKKLFFLSTPNHVKTEDWDFRLDRVEVPNYNQLT